MPRGQKSKLRAREKRRKAHAEMQAQALKDAETFATEEEEAFSTAPAVPEDSPQNVSAAEPPNTSQESQNTPPITNDTTAAVSCTDSNEDANKEDEETPRSSKTFESFRRDPLNKRVVLLVQFLLQKYQSKEPITKADMLKYVIKKYKLHFNEILRRASEHMELAFGIDLKEVDPTRHYYVLVSKLDLTCDGTMSEDDMPKTGLLMIVLGVIFMNGNCAPEEAIWEVLNLMGIYADKNHLIYGDPRKIITKDLVQLNYLEYREVPDSDPPRYEFQWGPRAHAETSKMKVLEFLAKIYDTVPSAFPIWYEEALQDEEERAQARAAARARIAASAPSRAMAASSSHTKYHGIEQAFYRHLHTRTSHSNGRPSQPDGSIARTSRSHGQLTQPGLKDLHHPRQAQGNANTYVDCPTPRVQGQPTPVWVGASSRSGCTQSRDKYPLEISKPLYEAAKKTPMGPLTSPIIIKRTFSTLRDTLISSPPLDLPDPTCPFHLFTDEKHERRPQRPAPPFALALCPGGPSMAARPKVRLPPRGAGGGGEWSQRVKAYFLGAGLWLRCWHHCCPLFLTSIIMPRGKKSKDRAREKRQQAKTETQSLTDVQATVAEVEESLSSTLPGESPQSSPAPGPSKEPQEAPATSSPEAGVSRPKSDEGAKSQREGSVSTSMAPYSFRRAHRDPLARNVRKLVQFLLEKLKMKEPITQAALQKVVNRKYTEQFPEVLRRASERMELIFGLKLKEVDHRNNTYAIVNKLGLPVEGDLDSDEVLSMTGLLIMLLGVIFMNGNHAPEEQIWEFLSALGIRPEKNHLIFGNPRKLITEDMVHQMYLEYCQVPNSDPPRYEFLWGPRAHAEISKMKVLEALAKFNGTVPSAFPDLYDQALRDEEDRACFRALAMAADIPKATVPSRAKSRSYSPT
ncbi:uncharacterized protein V5649_000147 [Rhynchonycteris naso]